jgi:hypothetical protein
VGYVCDCYMYWLADLSRVGDYFEKRSVLMQYKLPNGTTCERRAYFVRRQGVLYRDMGTPLAEVLPFGRGGGTVL